MKPPKILPRVASQAGISEELALKLWRRALGEAEYLSGRSAGSEYWRLAVERFLSLVDDEAHTAPAHGLMPAPQVSWMWRHQTRMSLLSLMAAQNAYRFWQHTWQKLYQPQQAA